MALITPMTTSDSVQSASTWTLSGQDEGKRVQYAVYDSRSVQIIVTSSFNNPSVLFQGSNDGTTWATLIAITSLDAGDTDIIPQTTIAKYFRPLVVASTTSDFSGKVILYGNRQ